jgi:hypothetical protein
MAATVTPYCSAMAISVSPGFTTWIMGVGDGVGVFGRVAVGNARVTVGRGGTVTKEIAAVETVVGAAVGVPAVTT